MFNALIHKPSAKELNRILQLPKRDAEKSGIELQHQMTELLRSTNGTMKLRPNQALAIYESYEYRGALLFFAVGTGKTLVTYLICSFYELMDDRNVRGCLLLPANLAKKTNREFSHFTSHWLSPSNISIIHYDALSRNPNLLHEIKPDILICDEAHRLSNKRSAVTRRVERYLRKNGETVFVGMSGTLVKRSIRDWHHLSQWALPSQLQCLPLTYHDIESWCAALDEKPRYRTGLGALKKIGRTRKEILKNLSKRFRETPGIIMCSKNSDLPKLYIITKLIENYTIQYYADYIREYWRTPSGTDFILALDLYRHMREISQGFVYEWTEIPPQNWVNARYDFNHFIHKKLSRSRTLDTVTQTTEQYLNNKIVQNWKKIESTYKPKSKANWKSYKYINTTIKHAHKNTIIWVSHKTVGRHVEKKFGIPYFGLKGLCANGDYVQDTKSDIICCSTQSISEGYNLQRFNNNIVTCPPKLGRKWEQLLGRTHRSGQKQDVFCTVLGTIDENFEDFEQAKKDAEYIQNKTSNKQKLCIGIYQ